MADENDNLIILQECTNGDIMPDGAYVTPGEILVTPFKTLEGSDNDYCCNITSTVSDGSKIWSQKLYLYDENYLHKSVVQLSMVLPYKTMYRIGKYANISGHKYARILFSVKNDTPYFGKSGII